MGKRQEYLNGVLHEIDNSTSFIKVPEFPTSDFHKEIGNIYRSLGGILPQYPTGFGAFDIIRSHYIIELDEERHFNRYREKTLKSTIYSQNAWFDVQNYVNYSKYRESNCFKSASHGGYWRNDSSEKQFGKSDPQGVIIKLGSSRWKQRAFYDYLRDVMSLLTGFPIIRISIYDMVNSTENVDSCLTKYRKPELIMFLRSKLQNLLNISV